MEIKRKSVPLGNEDDSNPWLNPFHPNYERWRRSRELSEERGKLVRSILSETLTCEKLFVLDLGSGEGGTSKVFSVANNVVSLDLSLVRLKRQFPKGGIPATFQNKISRINANALALPFKEKSFDLIIIQDVIEHVANPSELILNTHLILKDGGAVYLSTPNKLSIINLLSDPHFGLPFISLLKRKNIKKYFLKYFRKKDYHRTDVAQLLSLKELRNVFYNKFGYKLFTKEVVQKLFEGNKGIVWSNFHLSIIKVLRTLKLDKTILKISGNDFRIINKYFTPTFYFVLRKSDKNLNQ
ncbi:MAG: class I SAM-dependent methyltransferase [Ignavibacteriaceae bacterium]